MRFSVVMPLYNKALYVAKAIGSVLDQTFTDYELVIVDDGSSDNSAAIAMQAIEGHGQCRLIEQENAGVSVARNNGVAASKGDYVCFLDADDWWEPTFLEEMDKLVNEFPDAGIYGTNYTIVNETKRRTRVSPVGVDKNFEKGYIDYFQVYTTTLAMPLWTGAICIPRQVYDAVGGFNPQLKMGEDFDLWVRIAMKHKVAFLNKPLAFYNQDVEASKRAIGSLPPPEAQFAFCTDNLKEEMNNNALLKQIVECVQISCLRGYYLSKAYHGLAKEVLESMNIELHLGQAYADYLRRPVWMTRLIDAAARLKNYFKSWSIRLFCM